MLVVLSVILVIFLFYGVGVLIVFVGAKRHEYTPSEYDLSCSGVAAYVITLEHALERQEHTRPQVDALNLRTEIVWGVDGNQLSDQDILNAVDVKNYRGRRLPKYKGEVGCYLSHVKAWQNFLNSSYQYAVIFEDDVSFDPQLLRQTIDSIVRHSALWDICSFDAHAQPPLLLKLIQNLMSFRLKGKNVCSTKNVYTKACLPIFSLENGSKVVSYFQKTKGGGAYILNRKAVKLLLHKAMPMQLNVDRYFNQYWFQYLKFLGVENPKIVWHGLVHPSCISHSCKPDFSFRKETSSLEVFSRVRRIILNHLWRISTSLLIWLDGVSLMTFGKCKK